MLLLLLFNSISFALLSDPVQGSCIHCSVLDCFGLTSHLTTIQRAALWEFLQKCVLLAAENEKTDIKELGFYS